MKVSRCHAYDDPQNISGNMNWKYVTPLMGRTVLPGNLITTKSEGKRVIAGGVLNKAEICN